MLNKSIQQLRHGKSVTTPPPDSSPLSPASPQSVVMMPPLGNSTETRLHVQKSRQSVRLLWRPSQQVQSITIVNQFMINWIFSFLYHRHTPLIIWKSLFYLLKESRTKRNISTMLCAEPTDYENRPEPDATDQSWEGRRILQSKDVAGNLQRSLTCHLQNCKRR